MAEGGAESGASKEEEESEGSESEWEESPLQRTPVGGVAKERVPSSSSSETEGEEEGGGVRGGVAVRPFEMAAGKEKERSKVSYTQWSLQ